MFGHQTNNDQDNSTDHQDPQSDGMLGNGLEPETVEPSSAPSAPPVSDPGTGGYVMTDLPTVGASADGTPTLVSAPTATAALSSAPADPVVSAPATSAPTATPAVSDELLDLKQSALHELSPLLGHLEQAPEEKFRTTMMMIQASDDQSLLQTAYEAAKSITDEKARAQALLDVVNEINYFTQQSNTN